MLGRAWKSSLRACTEESIISIHTNKSIMMDTMKPVQSLRNGIIVKKCLKSNRPIRALWKPWNILHVNEIDDKELWRTSISKSCKRTYKNSRVLLIVCRRDATADDTHSGAWVLCRRGRRKSSNKKITRKDDSTTNLIFYVNSCKYRQRNYNSALGNP